MPYIRFFTDDVASITHAKCPCGSTHMRFSYHGREDWGVNVKGIPTTVFPPDIEAVIYRHREVFGQPWQIVKFKEQPQDKLVVRVSCDPKITRDEKGLARRLGEDLGKEFKVDTEIEMVKAEEIAASAYKYVKVFKR
jgi:phenylacetate-coenzyme A ligase PaaK-like adenylate-forming protein